jgi:hypothetical protein
MLTVNPHQRITLEEIQGHAWLQQGQPAERVGLPPAEFHEAEPAVLHTGKAADHLSLQRPQNSLAAAATAAPASCLKAAATPADPGAPPVLCDAMTGEAVHLHERYMDVDMEERADTTHPTMDTWGQVFTRLFSLR